MCNCDGCRFVRDQYPTGIVIDENLIAYEGHGWMLSFCSTDRIWRPPCKEARISIAKEAIRRWQAYLVVAEQEKE